MVMTEKTKIQTTKNINNKIMKNKIILFSKKILKALKVFISRVLADGGIIEAKNYVNSVLKTVGDASLVLIPSAYKSGVLYSILPEDGTGDFTASRNSVATRINPNGFIEEVGVNVPRIDYTDGTPVLLTEPQSTNLVTYSEDFSDVSWLKTTIGDGVVPIVTSNYGISPDGTQNTDRVQFDSGSAGGSQLQASITYGTEGHTFSVWLKSLTVTKDVTMFLGDATQNKTVTTVWQRFTFSNSTSSSTIRIALRDVWGTAGVADLLIWGAQLEQLPYATSYIPTEGTTATRLLETVTDGGDVNTFNSAEGVLFVEMSALSDEVENFKHITLIANATNYLQIFIYSNAINFKLTKGGANIFQKNYPLADIASYNKIALNWDSLGNYKSVINGVILDNFASEVLSLDVANLSFTNSSLSAPLFGKTKQLQVFKTALTDAELIELTTI